MVVAIGASGLALWLAAGRERRPPLILSAAAFGMAISGMHYTAMAGLTLFPHASLSSGAPALSSDLLAIVVAIVAFIVSGIFLLLLVPDRMQDRGGRPRPVRRDPARAPAPSPVGRQLAARRPGDERAASVRSAALARRRRRLARRLPVERDGVTHSVAVDDIVAVHANAHYTYIFDGTPSCSARWRSATSNRGSTAAVSSRVHRSHIVNLDRVVGLKRAGDGGLVELAGPDRYSVPVARSRVSWFKARIGSKLDAVAS